MIWSATFILAFIRLWHKSHRDLTEERNKWEEQQRVPSNRVRERRIIRRRRRRRRRTSSTTESSAAVTPSDSRESTGSDGDISRDVLHPETQKLLKNA
ncbi:hypothetical protein CRE_24698 [Caenorhabditis remanei]|uniref:Uncharacterized protein n=1 Tax=Caenorhabditis remanei TaxID=31234 RepID=E3N3V9_CAERE|nr:hypothetical protein CRE_24698 [Caenorhabditis remanei]